MRDDLVMICFQMRDRRYMNFRNNEQMYRSLGMNVGKHPDLGIFKNSFRFKRAASNFTKKTIHDCNSFEKNPSVILNASVGSRFILFCIEILRFAQNDSKNYFSDDFYKIFLHLLQSSLQKSNQLFLRYSFLNTRVGFAHNDRCINHFFLAKDKGDWSSKFFCQLQL